MPDETCRRERSGWSDGPKPSASAIHHRVIEAELTRRLGVAWRDRPDRLRELDGVSDELIDAFSTRRRAIIAEVEKLARAYEDRYGIPPPAAVCYRMAQDAILTTRRTTTTRPPTMVTVRDDGHGGHADASGRTIIVPGPHPEPYLILLVIFERCRGDGATTGHHLVHQRLRAAPRGREEVANLAGTTRASASGALDGDRSVTSRSRCSDDGPTKCGDQRDEIRIGSKCRLLQFSRFCHHAVTRGPRQLWAPQDQQPTTHHHGSVRDIQYPGRRPV